MRRLAILLTCACALTSCMSKPDLRLDERLAGKSAAEASDVLLAACLTEARWAVTNSPEYRQSGERRRSQMRNNPSLEVRDMQALCRAMNLASIATAPRLASQCQQLMSRRGQRFGTRSVSHLERVKMICERMTGEEIRPVELE